MARLREWKGGEIPLGFVHKEMGKRKEKRANSATAYYLSYADKLTGLLMGQHSLNPKQSWR